MSLIVRRLREARADGDVSVPRGADGDVGGPAGSTGTSAHQGIGASMTSERCQLGNANRSIALLTRRTIPEVV